MFKVKFSEYLHLFEYQYIVLSKRIETDLEL
jgi:hypothetical protein